MDHYTIHCANRFSILLFTSHGLAGKNLIEVACMYIVKKDSQTFDKTYCKNLFIYI